MKKIIAPLVLVSVLAFGVVSCGTHEVACAAVVKGGGSSGGSSGGGSSAGRSSGGASSGARSSSGSSGGPSRPPSPPAPKSTPPKSGNQAAASSASKPSSTPTAEQKSTAQSTAPTRVTKGGTYYSTVTGNTYVYNDFGYYRRPGYVVDIYDPYNPYNYWYFGASPFYGRPYVVAGDCDDEGHVEQKQEVNITMDSDGKVTEVKDK